MGNKFILKGDEINSNKESDEKGDETKVWNTMITHDPEDRDVDGRWERTIVQEKRPVREIRWKGLYDKNSDKQYASKAIMMMHTRK